MSVGNLLVKVELEGEFRRFRVAEGNNQADTWANLNEALRSGFDLKENAELCLKYRDDEGDLCILAKGTLQDCVEQAQGGLIKLFATRTSSIKPCAGPDPVPQLPLRQPEHQQDPMQGIPQEQIEDHTGEQDPPPSDEQNDHEDTDGFATTGCRGMGPWKLLVCLGSLWHSGRMSKNMIASLILQFLPKLAQRAHRKQDMLNWVGTQRREMLLPLLHRVFLQLDTLPGTEKAKAGLEVFMSGTETSSFGECIAKLLETLSTMDDKAAVAQVIKDASEELLDVLPRILPKTSPCLFMPVPEHVGTACSGCSAQPIIGPRFHNLAANMDLCGECFIDCAFDASLKFECQLVAAEQGRCNWGWGDGAEHVGWPWKGKGKGKKGKGFWFHHMASPDHVEQNLNECGGGDHAQQSVPEGVAPCRADAEHVGWPWKGKGKGKKGKGFWFHQMASPDHVEQTVRDGDAQQSASEVAAPWWPEADAEHVGWPWKGKGKGKKGKGFWFHHMAHHMASPDHVEQNVREGGDGAHAQKSVPEDWSCMQGLEHMCKGKGRGQKGKGCWGKGLPHVAMGLAAMFEALAAQGAASLPQEQSSEPAGGSMPQGLPHLGMAGMFEALAAQMAALNLDSAVPQEQSTPTVEPGSQEAPKEP